MCVYNTNSKIYEADLYIIRWLPWSYVSLSSFNTVLQEGWTSPFLYLNQFIVTSILLAIYGLQFFVRASAESLDKHRVRFKFMVLQFVLLFSNLQNAIFRSLLVKFEIPACKGRWGTTFRASSKLTFPQRNLKRVIFAYCLVDNKYTQIRNLHIETIKSYLN